MHQIEGLEANLGRAARPNFGRFLLIWKMLELCDGLEVEWNHLNSCLAQPEGAAADGDFDDAKIHVLSDQSPSRDTPKKLRS